MGCDFFGGDVGRVGMGVLSGLGGCLNCCSPVAKCPKDEVGNGRIMGFGGMGRMIGGGCVALRWVFSWLQVGGAEGRGGAGQKERPPAGTGGRDLLYRSDLGASDGRYSSGSSMVVAAIIVDHEPKPLSAGARFWARTR